MTAQNNSFHFEICNREYCTGCSACVQSCSHNAITMQEDQNGFLYPRVANELCTRCGTCMKICPCNSTPQKKSGRIYAALTKDDRIRAESSSGGIFSILAEEVLSSRGMVFGAAMSADLTVKHIGIENKDDLQKLRRSKYIQSQINGCFRAVKEYLLDGRKVLFSGTPCQVAGLKNYLKKDFLNLITIDLLCHGVPSQKVLDKYIHFCEEEAREKATDVIFRVKEPGWAGGGGQIVFFNNKRMRKDRSFFKLFLSNICLRESCYNCQFCIPERVGDISLGDFWGYTESPPYYLEDDDLGISFVSLNTTKGTRLFLKTKSRIAYTRRSLKDALPGNPLLTSPVKKPSDYEKFWNDLDRLSWSEICERYKISSAFYDEWMSHEDRAYYALPFLQRHYKHLFFSYTRLSLKLIKYACTETMRFILSDSQYESVKQIVKKTQSRYFKCDRRR